MNLNGQQGLAWSSPGACLWLGCCALAWVLLALTCGIGAVGAAPPTALEDFAFTEPDFEVLELTKSPHPAVNAVLQDAQGWLWIGTDEGLLRYDGYRIRKFVHDDADPTSLGGDFITALWLGKDGRLWVGTFSNGVSVFDPRSEQFTHLRHDPAQPASLSGGWVHAIAGDEAGGVWIGTNEGLDYVKGVPAAGDPALRHYRHDPNNPTSLLDNRVRSLLIDKQGTLWVGSFSGLQRYQPTAPAVGFVRIASNPANPNSLAGQEVLALFQAQDGKLWVGTKKQGAAWFNPAATTQAASPDSNNPTLHWLLPDPQRADRLSHGCVYAIAQPQAGKIWLGTFGGGINIVSAQDGTVLQRLKHDPANASSLTHDNIRALLPDRSGMLWIATRGGGLQRYHPAQSAFHVLRYRTSQPGGLSHPEVRSVLELADGRILVGTGGNGIDILDRKHGIIGNYRAQPGVPGTLPDGTIRALLQTADGTLWAGTQQAGAARLLPGSRVWQTFSGAQGLPSPQINRFLLSKDGTLWASTISGVARWQPQAQRFEAARQANGHPFQSYVPAMAEDGQGRLWAASNIGLWLKPAGENVWQLIQNQPTRPDSLLANDVRGLLVDANGRLWVASSRGLDRLQSWDGQHAVFEHISAKAGKAGMAIGENLWQDRQGRIWIDHGGQVLDPQTLRFADNASPDLGTTWRGAHSQTRDGWLMYGGSLGLALFDPAKFQPWAFQAPIRATSLKIDGKTIAPDALPLRLGPTQRNFSVEFSALDFFKPEQNRYRYRLQGYDPDWIHTDWEHRLVSYGNLWPGHYRLQVQGSNSAGQWQTAQLEIAIEILPAFWQTGWFAALVLLTGSASVLAIHRWRNARLRAQARALQSMVEQRTAEALAAHNEAIAAHHEAVSAQNQLALARQLEQTREQMLQQEKMAALGTLTAGVAHEINNPSHFTYIAAQIQRNKISAFEQYVQALFDDEVAPAIIQGFRSRFSELQENVGTILEGTERIQTIVKDLRAFSRREHEQKRAVQLSAGLLSTLNLVRITWSDQVEFITEFADDPLYECWPSLLNQVFMNLIVNGCHAIASKRKGSGIDHPARGHLWLRLRQQGQTLVVEIEDDGCGIEPAVRERILEPFFTTKEVDSGTGLGLSIAHGIIQKHGGTLKIESTPGQGSCFTVHLPLASKETA